MQKTKTSFLVARLFVIVALAVTAWALIHKTGVDNTDEAGIVLRLPERVGDWTGIDLLFCSARDCGKPWLAPELKGSSVCPSCGAPIATISWPEKTMLPADTGLVRKYYVRPGGTDAINTTIVLSGDDRSSIHRPQVCMTAAGYEIMDERTIRVPIAGRPDPLDIRVLNMTKTTEATPDTPATLTHIYYAYWFVGNGRETADHIQRMVWMGYDRVFHGVSHRWAYISLSGNRLPDSSAHLQTIANFASRLHPAILKPASSFSSGAIPVPPTDAPAPQPITQGQPTS